VTNQSPGARRIPKATIKRLPAYLRVLQETREERVTSVDLGRDTGFSSEQVRKDLAYFGAFGTRGVGYVVSDLEQQIRRILGLNQPINAVVVGAGHLGTALARFTQLANHDVRIVGLFDVDPTLFGREVAGIAIFPIDQLEAVVRERCVRIGVVAVPASAAREVGERLYQSGVRAILNFAPIKICVGHDDVEVHDIDLSIELQALAYFVSALESAPPLPVKR
jgi:redox-sensing transcriptional repressor